MGDIHSAFKTLGLGNDATPREIKLSYLKWAKKLHPDINKDDPKANKKFVDLQNAYETVIDQKNQKNRGIKPKSTNKPPKSNMFWQDLSEFDSIFASFFKGITSSRASSHLDNPKTHMDLRKTSRRKSTIHKKDLFSKFDREIDLLINFWKRFSET